MAPRRPKQAGSGVERIVDLLGGEALFGRPCSTELDFHEIILGGLPAESLLSFLRRVPELARADSLAKVASVRTLQRRKNRAPAGKLTRAQSSRLYVSAKIVAEAIGVFGSVERAQRFLQAPAMALERRRPIDLLSTPAGVELVQGHLRRLSLGVYT